MKPRSDAWSLTRAARALDQPQHRLIYLCDQGVVRPDVEDARGRGSSRLFSARNLLEFAVALELRALQIPASTLVAVVHVLRAFEKGVQERSSETDSDSDFGIRFELPHFLRGSVAPDLRIVVGDGRRLYVSIRPTGVDPPHPPTIFGGIDLKMLGDGERPDVKEVGGVRSHPDDFGGPEGSRYSRVEVSVTHLAQDLRLSP